MGLCAAGVQGAVVWSEAQPLLGHVAGRVCNSFRRRVSLGGARFADVAR
jgi:hypothetical protein